MEYMMRNYERPLTRKEMAEYAWQSQDDSSNIVDVYVNFLRKKIELLTDKNSFTRSAVSVISSKKIMKSFNLPLNGN